MLCNEDGSSDEQGPSQCFVYWPDAVSKTQVRRFPVVPCPGLSLSVDWLTARLSRLPRQDYGELKVMCVHETVNTGAARRRILALHHTGTGETRTVYHWQFTGWPDYGTPDPREFLAYQCGRGGWRGSFYPIFFFLAGAAPNIHGGLTRGRVSDLQRAGQQVVEEHARAGAPRGFPVKADLTGPIAHQYA